MSGKIFYSAKLLVIAAFALSVFSCTAELVDETLPSEEPMMVLHAIAASDDNSDTKVTWDPTWKFLEWQGNDRIGVYRYDIGSFLNAVTSDNGPQANFNLTRVNQDDYPAIYPYSASCNYDDETATFTTPFKIVQQGTASSFDREAYVGVALGGADKNLSFKNACAFVGFTLTQQDAQELESISICDAKGEAVFPETLKISYNGGDPIVSAADNARLYETISLSAPAGGFIVGQRYYFILPPVNLPNGVKITLTRRDGLAAGKTGKSSLNLKRNSNINLGNIGGLEYAQSESIFMDVVRVTNSTAVVAWTNDEALLPYIGAEHPSYDASSDIGKEYRIELYSDAQCDNLVLAWNLPVTYSSSKGGAADTNMFSATYPPRFIFSGLTPSTDYYVKVKNITDGTFRKSALKFTTAPNPFQGVSVKTRNAVVGDCLVAESFDKCLYGGDITCLAAGYSRYDRSSMTSLSGGYAQGDNPPASNNNFYVVNGSTEMGLFNTLAKILGDMGLSDWGWISEDDDDRVICARPGYLKIGAYSKRTSIVLPSMGAIPTGYKADVTVSFKAATYGSTSYAAAEKDIQLRVYESSQIGSGNITSTGALVYSSGVINLKGDGQWNDYSVTLSNVTPTSRIAICSAREGTGTQGRFHLDDVKVVVKSLSSSVYRAEGYVKYSDGTAAVNVTVSDGEHVTYTDQNGYYSLLPTADTRYIYISMPEDAVISKNTLGQPSFFKTYGTSTSRYDFTLTRQPVETQFRMFALADPQAHYQKRGSQTKTDTDRFRDETVPAVNNVIASSSLPCYGVTLGDIVYSEGSRNSNPGMTTMRTHCAAINMPLFQVMGNHDFTYFGSSATLNTDSSSSTLFLKAQRSFESVFGPINYSFNRGNVHFVCMRDIIWNSASDASVYVGGFSDEQYQWLQADLANVPKTKMVILCVHIPIVGLSGKSHVSDVLNLIKQYTNSQIFSGHTHYMRNVKSCLSSGIYEHVHAAVCGNWWWSNVNGDGSPNGFEVYDINGTTIQDSYYVGSNNHMNTRESAQIRVYRGGTTVGGAYVYFKTGGNSKTLYINVFNADDSWKVQVNTNMGWQNATLMANSRETFSAVQGQTYEVGNSSSQDWWSIGYVMGVVGRGLGTSTSYYTTNYHMYKFEFGTILNSEPSTISVRATDKFGHTYTTSEVMTDMYPTGTYPSWFKPGTNGFN